MSFKLGQETGPRLPIRSAEEAALIHRFKAHAEIADRIIQKPKRTVDEALELQRSQKAYREAARELGGIRLVRLDGEPIED